ncbi:hypothetical protein [Paraburkholderia sp. J11-2]|uniref:hypothetical protein n=1 Tax=Paraburkholderia sp. J11-2 TaxID=2805431 RepID=UPI002AB6433A|nr:hypothetical protein [Paraburkholderia sp. J11-2]
MKESNEQEDIRLLVALRAEAGKYNGISERRMSGCTTFALHGSIAACVCGNLIALKLPELSVAALLQTPGCRSFQPFGQLASPHWLAFTVTSPAFEALDQLFEEAVAFVQESSDG